MECCEPRVGEFKPDSKTGGVFVGFCAFRTEGRLLTSGHSVLVRPPERVVWAQYSVFFIISNTVNH